jgi:hypothetical protein
MNIEVSNIATLLTAAFEAQFARVLFHQLLKRFKAPISLNAM